MNEPDEVKWHDEATGMPCWAIRCPGGYWCGYVGVKEGHRAFDHHYDDVRADVHGGLSFSGWSPDHNPVDAEDFPPIWWLGFDCAHYDDVVPEWNWQFGIYEGSTYKDLEFVRRECTSLALQLSEPPRDEE